jgi:small conductance mechanosensitive channel
MDKAGEIISTVENAKAAAIAFIVTYGFQILGALIVLTAGLLVARWVGNLIMKALLRREMEPPVRNLIVRVSRLAVVMLSIIIALDTAGVKTAPLVAGLGVAGVGIGLAMQGVLGNLVAGLLIIVVKKFRVGEYIEIHDVEGEVVAIELFSTTLMHPDKSRVIIPNRKIVGEILHNYGTMRQLDLQFSVAYRTDLLEAIEVIKQILAANPRVIKDPEPVVRVIKYGDSAVEIMVGPWVAVKDFGAARGELNLAIFDALKTANISIPFPQREIRILNDFNPAAAK